jgi:excisionase family DNA binding protein
MAEMINVMRQADGRRGRESLVPLPRLVNLHAATKHVWDEIGMNEQLAAIIDDPAKIVDLRPEVIPVLMAQVAAIQGEYAAIQSSLTARLVSQGSRAPHYTSETDKLLNVKQAADLLGCSTDYLYRHPARYRQLEVRDGGAVRFSKRAIDEYIRRNTGRRN